MQIFMLLQLLSIEDATDAKDEEFLLRRLDAGLFVLQLIDYIMIDICHAGPPTVSTRCMSAHILEIVYGCVGV